LFDEVLVDKEGRDIEERERIERGEDEKQRKRERRGIGEQFLW